ncbi:hypothetical protein [Stenotrophomonas panacihumi]|uniref:hypothetical protein n=1 Tax=Stenotrophomonas panacihumi TaxID=676599 RepID=UPI001FD35ED8|nr:hypothetical protein [Stenotrophomonas panacihumi]
MPLDTDASAMVTELMLVGLAATPVDVVRKYLWEASAQRSTGVGAGAGAGAGDGAGVDLPSPQRASGAVPQPRVAPPHPVVDLGSIVSQPPPPPAPDVVQLPTNRLQNPNAWAESMTTGPPTPIENSVTAAAVAAELPALFFLLPFAISDATTQRQVAAFHTIR